MIRDLWRRSWRKLAALAAVGVLASTAADVSYAQNPEPANLLERLERLEQQNRDLQQKLQSVTTPVSTSASGGIDARAIENIVSEYLQAQAKKEEAKKNEPVAVGSDLNFKANWKDGINFETANKDFKFHVGGRIHFDFGAFDEDPTLPVFEDAANFRRLRLRADGTMWEIFNWVTEIDFANSSGVDSSAVFTDCYADITQLPWIGAFRVGRFKEPFSLEELTSSRYINHIERSIAHQAFVPARSLGLMVHRTFGDEQRVSVFTGMFRDDTSDGVEPSRGNGGFGRGDAEYSWTSRLTVRPVWEQNGRCFVHLGGAYSFRNYRENGNNVSENYPRYRAGTEARLGTPTLLDTGILFGNASSHLWGGELAAQYGPLSLMSDVYYVQANLEDGMGNAVVTPHWWGGYVQVGYFLTGEHRGYSRSSGAFDRVIPHENFFCVKGEDGCINRGLGAWEVIFRVSYLDLDDEDFFVAAGGDSRTGGTGIMRDFTVGVNWYLNPNMKWMFNWVHSNRTSASGADFSGTVDSLIARFAMDF